MNEKAHPLKGLKLNALTLTITNKIVVMSALFVLTLTGALLYLSYEVGNDAGFITTQNTAVDKQQDAMSKQKDLLAQQTDLLKQQNSILDNQNQQLAEQTQRLTHVEDAQLLYQQFAEMRFWFYDAALSLNSDSLEQAITLRGQALAKLTEFSSKEPEFVEQIIPTIDDFSAQIQLAYNSGFAFDDISDDSDYFSSARDSGLKLDSQFNDFFSQLTAESIVIRTEISNSSTTIQAQSAQLAQLNKQIRKQGIKVHAFGQKVRQASTSVSDSHNQLQYTSYIILVASVIVTLVLATLFTRSITQPIKSVRDTVRRIEEHSDLQTRIDYQKDDEIGAIAKAINHMIGKFQNIIREVSFATEHLAQSAQHSHAITQRTDDGVQQQRQEIKQVATAMTDMVQTVQQVAQNTTCAVDAAGEANQQANHGQNIVEQTIQAINNVAQTVSQSGEVISRVAEDSNNIGQVLDVIRDISEQTNLLALNAAIEAARAGDNGRGFAVVADEVRGLAQRTNQSTTEIQSMIERLHKGTSEAVNMMQNSQKCSDFSVEEAGKAGEALSQITESIAKIHQLNTQIADATEKQTNVVRKIDDNINNISSVVGNVAQNTEQNRDASQQLNELSHSLQELVSQFRT